MPSNNSNTSSRRRAPPPLNPIAPPSSAYSHQSQRSVPVSPLSTASQADGSRAHIPPSHRRPNSSAFFHGTMAAPPAVSAGSYPPSRFAHAQQPSFSAANRYPGSTLNGYDGAYSHLPPSSSHNHPSQVPYPAPYPASPSSRHSRSGSGTSKRDSKSNSSGASTKSGKSLRNHVLKVDRASLSTAAKLGIWLMGSTPKRMEKAAEAQRERRQRAREERGRWREEKGRRGVGAGAMEHDDEEGFEEFGDEE